MEEQKKVENWLEKEAEALKSSTYPENRLPVLRLEENKITEITIDFSKEFDKWIDEKTNTIKRIIPVKVKGVDYIWFLNVKNPIYSKIIAKGLKGQTTFKILQTGSKQTTKYTLIEE